MDSVGSFEAKTHLARLLERVSQGEEIIITRHGVPVARLVPANRVSGETVASAIRELRSFRKGRLLGKLTIRKLIEEGRRF